LHSGPWSEIYQPAVNVFVKSWRVFKDLVCKLIAGDEADATQGVNLVSPGKNVSAQLESVRISRPIYYFVRPNLAGLA
jgi:hypothetical protein